MRIAPRIQDVRQPRGKSSAGTRPWIKRAHEADARTIFLPLKYKSQNWVLVSKVGTQSLDRMSAITFSCFFSPISVLLPIQIIQIQNCKPGKTFQRSRREHNNYSRTSTGLQGNRSIKDHLCRASHVDVVVFLFPFNFQWTSRQINRTTPPSMTLENSRNNNCTSSSSTC